MAGIVFVCDGRTKRCIQVTTLVADGQLNEGPFVPCEDHLDLADKAVEFFPRLRITVVVNAKKAQEKGHRWAKFGEKGAVPALLAFKDSG